MQHLCTRLNSSRWFFSFSFFLLGKVSSKLWKRDQGKSQPYSWNRCYFCKKKCRSIWPGMQHLRDTHADVDQYYGWLLKTLETAVRPIFTCFPVWESKVSKEKMVCNSTMLWMCIIHSSLALTRWDFRVHAMSLHDPYGRIIPKGKPYLGSFYLCACMHYTFLLWWCYVSHWNVFTCGNFPIP